MARPGSASTLDCNSQLSLRADSSVTSANRSSLSSSCEQVRKARRPSCSTTRSSSSAKPSSASALSSARREATRSVVTCNRRPLSTGSFSAINPSASARSAGRSNPRRRRSRARPKSALLYGLVGLTLTRPIQAHVAVDAYAHQQAKSEHDRQHCGPTIRNQRQRDANDGNQAGHHCGVDEHIEKKIYSNPGSQQSSKMIAATQSDCKTVNQYYAIETEQS